MKPVSAALTWPALMVLAAASLQAAPERPSRDPSFLPIFDGKTLAGWHVSGQTGHGTGGRWVVEDGAIVGSQDKPGNGGILITDKAYGDFEVALEMRNDFGPDSGLFLRSTEKGEAYQAMIDYHPRGNLMGIYGEGLPGNVAASNFQFRETVTDIAPVHEPYPLPVKPGAWPSFWKHGVWNELRARIVGNPPHVTTWIGGTKWMEWTDTERRLADSGRIALQVHGGGDFTRQFVRYRNVRVRELSPVAAGTVNGPIRVSDDGRHFTDRDGRPFFWLGDTAWPLFAQYTKDQAEAYFANRSGKGFTVVQGVLAWGLGTGFENKAPIANTHGDKPWLNDDASTPNDAYFRHVDDLVDSANRQGLVLAMLPTWGYYVNDTALVDAAKARAYGRWLGARYKSARNVVWVNGGDRIATGFEDVYRELARGLREGDGGAHLITYHPCGWRSSSQYFHGDDWLGFDMIETWTEWAKVYPAMLSDTLLSPRKPVVLGEGAYEDGPEYPQGPITPLIVRRQAWWTVMAGGFPTYGQNQMWRMEPGWERTFDTPGASHVARMKEIVTALRWWEMVPDQGIFATGVGSERTLNAALRSYRGDGALLYLSSQCTFTLHLDKIASKDARATWINPATGERRHAGAFRTGNLNGKSFPDAETQTFTVPGHWEDAVLLLEADDGDHPAGLTQKPGASANNWYDAAGNLYVKAGNTGRWSNYDEAKAGGYTLPDPLVLKNGEHVTDAEIWLRRRRPEILDDYLSAIYGRIPDNAPKVGFGVVEMQKDALEATAIMKRLVGRVGDGPTPRIDLTLYTPVNAVGPVPLIIGVGPGVPGFGPPHGGAPVADILARGWGWGEVGTSSIQADRNDFTAGVIGLTLAPGQTRPAPDQWGVLSAWAWGLGRVMDYLETERTVDARQVALYGHSRWGKTVLWAAALDPRFALVYSSCSGEMGTSLSRRDWGETVDNMAGDYLGYQFAFNFRKYAGRWNDLPVDAHMLISLLAPRPLFITGGSTDQWSDPHGEFLAAVAAGPVYRLLGRRDLGTTEMPDLDIVLDSGELAFTNHNGGHWATPADWRAFLKFADKYFKTTAGPGGV